MQGLVPNQMRGSPFHSFSVAVYVGRHADHLEKLSCGLMDIRNAVWRGMNYTKQKMEDIEPWLKLLFKGVNHKSRQFIVSFSTNKYSATYYISRDLMCSIFGELPRITKVTPFSTLQFLIAIFVLFTDNPSQFSPSSVNHARRYHQIDIEKNFCLGSNLH